MQAAPTQTPLGQDIVERREVVQQVLREMLGKALGDSSPKGMENLTMSTFVLGLWRASNVFQAARRGSLEHCVLAWSLRASPQWFSQTHALHLGHMAGAVLWYQGGQHCAQRFSCCRSSGLCSDVRDLTLLVEMPLV